MRAGRHHQASAISPVINPILTCPIRAATSDHRAPRVLPREIGPAVWSRSYRQYRTPSRPPLCPRRRVAGQENAAVSTMAEHTFHGTHTPCQNGGKCHPCVRNKLSPMSRVTQQTIVRLLRATTDYPKRVAGRRRWCTLHHEAEAARAKGRRIARRCRIHGARSLAASRNPCSLKSSLSFRSLGRQTEFAQCFGQVQAWDIMNCRHACPSRSENIGGRVVDKDAGGRIERVAFEQEPIDARIRFH